MFNTHHGSLRAVRLEINSPPRTPSQDAWDARMGDWMEDNDRILRLEEEYMAQYREKICSKCSPEQRIRRSCSSLMEGCDDLECDHMRDAFARKHKKILDHNMEIHPFIVRMALNEGLKKRQEGTAAGAKKRP